MGGIRTGQRVADVEISYTQTGQTTNDIELTLASPLDIATNSIVAFKTIITGIQSNGVAPNLGACYHHKFTGTIKNIGGTVSLVNSVTEITRGDDAEASGFSAFVIENNTTKTLDVIVTGEVGKTIEWRSETKSTVNSFI